APVLAFQRPARRAAAPINGLLSVGRTRKTCLLQIRFVRNTPGLPGPRRRTTFDDPPPDCAADRGCGDCSRRASACAERVSGAIAQPERGTCECFAVSAG